MKVDTNAEFLKKLQLNFLELNLPLLDKTGFSFYDMSHIIYWNPNYSNMHIVIYVQINEYTYICVVYQLHAQGGNHYIIIKKITVTIFHNFWWFWWWLVIIYIILCFLWILMIFKDFSQFFWQILFWQCTLRGAILTCWLLITYRYICGEKNLSPCPYAYHIYIYEENIYICDQFR